MSAKRITPQEFALLEAIIDHIGIAEVLHELIEQCAKKSELCADHDPIMAKRWVLLSYAIDKLIPKARGLK